MGSMQWWGNKQGPETVRDPDCLSDSGGLLVITVRLPGCVSEGGQEKAWCEQQHLWLSPQPIYW